MSAEQSRRRRRRRRFYIGGTEWRVQIVPRTDPRMIDDDGSTLEGHCINEECLVLIAEDLSTEAREEVFVHEVFEHAINIVSGAKHEMGLRFRSEKTRAEHEERIVRARTPHLHRVLKDLGFRFPRGLLQ